MERRDLMKFMLLLIEYTKSSVSKKPFKCAGNLSVPPQLLQVKQLTGPSDRMLCPVTDQKKQARARIYAIWTASIRIG